MLEEGKEKGEALTALPLPEEIIYCEESPQRVKSTRVHCKKAF